MTDYNGWVPVQVFGNHLGLMPDGGCYWYEGCEGFPSFEAAVAAVRDELALEWASAIKTYAKIVADFDAGRGYDEYFTPKRIESFRSNINQYPEWIRFLREGRWLVCCRGVDEENPNNCRSSWVDGYTPETLGDCACGRKLKYV